MTVATLLVGLGLIIAPGVYSLCYGTSDWPFLIFDKGDTARINCTFNTTELADVSYFWHKERRNNTSELIAFNVVGNPSSSGKYKVLSDGTLVISNMSQSDSGNYYCRLVTDTTESVKNFTLYLQVEADELDLSIEQCNSKPMCNIKLDAYSTLTLTCSANFVSESMTLKWYNGSNEIIGDIVADQKKKVSSSITITFESSSHLECEAVGIGLPRSIVFLHLEETDEGAEASCANLTIWVAIVVVLLLTCVVFGVLIILTNCRMNARSKQKGTEGYETFPVKDTTECEPFQKTSLQEENETLKNESNFLKSENENLKKEMYKLKEEYKTLQKQNDSLKDDMEALKEDKEDLMMTNSKLTAQLAKFLRGNQSTTSDCQYESGSGKFPQLPLVDPVDKFHFALDNARLLCRSTYQKLLTPQTEENYSPAIGIPHGVRGSAYFWIKRLLT